LSVLSLNLTLKLKFLSLDDVPHCQTQSDPILQLLYLEPYATSLLMYNTINQSESLVTSFYAFDSFFVLRYFYIRPEVILNVPFFYIIKCIDFCFDVIGLFYFLFLRTLHNHRLIFFHQVIKSVCRVQREFYEICVKALIRMFIFCYDFSKIRMKVNIICIRSILGITIAFHLHRSCDQLKVSFKWILIA
jgi:hypothetical protein